jgi:hypothetical protein
MPSPVYTERENETIELQERAQHLVATSVDALKKSIHNHPGMALLVSASIGVVLAWLTKRR